ncbi:hypothetical protein [Paracoccus sp. (in: a-proteobacteria)]|uniref:hypothetical protein n=1 Tax=Paracoccus sp. TaxID=267 RepID=UPI003A8C0B2C
MPHVRRNPSHRFVVVYRRETREISGAVEVWRGWIERIPDPRQRVEEGQTEGRLGFNELAEIPGLMMQLIDEAKQCDRRKRS